MANCLVHIKGDKQLEKYFNVAKDSEILGLAVSYYEKLHGELEALKVSIDPSYTPKEFDKNLVIQSENDNNNLKNKINGVSEKVEAKESTSDKKSIEKVKVKDLEVGDEVVLKGKEGTWKVDKKTKDGVDLTHTTKQGAVYRGADDGDVEGKVVIRSENVTQTENSALKDVEKPILKEEPKIENKIRYGGEDKDLKGNPKRQWMKPKETSEQATNRMATFLEASDYKGRETSAYIDKNGENTEVKLRNDDGKWNWYEPKSKKPFASFDTAKDAITFIQKQPFWDNGELNKDGRNDAYFAKVKAEHIKTELENGNILEDINDGKISAKEAKAIIESAGLKVPKDILEQSLPTQEQTTSDSNVIQSENIALKNALSNKTPKFIKFIKDYANKQLQRLSSKSEQGRKDSGAINAIATIIASEVHRDVKEKQGVSNPNAYGKIKQLEEVALQKYAEENGLLVELPSEENDTNEGGNESHIYINKDPNKFTKVTIPNNYNSWLELLDSIAIHNAENPNTQYEIKGFTKNKDGDFSIVVEQFKVQGIPAEFSKIHQDLLSKGYEQSGDYGDGRYIHKEKGIVLEDVKEDNVLEDKDGSLFYIDSDYYPYDMQRGGNVSIEYATVESLLSKEQSTSDSNVILSEDKGEDASDNVIQSETLTTEETEIANELKITEDEAKRAKSASPKRTRKSKPIVEAIESETKTIEDSNDGQRAADVIQTIEAAEKAILKGSVPNQSFEEKYEVSETELYKEYNSLDKKQADIGKAYESLTGKELKGSQWRASDEEKAYYTQFVADFLNAISKEGIVLKYPINIDKETDIQLEFTPTSTKPLKTSGAESLGGIVIKDDLRPIMQGVYIDNGQYIATDANQLVIINKTESDNDLINKFRDAVIKAHTKLLGLKAATKYADEKVAELKKDGLNGKILDFKNGYIVEGKYPNYKSVIPQNIFQSDEQPIQKWIDIANGATLAMKNIGSETNILILDVDGVTKIEMGVNAKIFLSTLQALQANGAKTIRIGVQKADRGVTLYTDNGNLGLVMPIMIKTDGGENVPRTTPTTLTVSVSKEVAEKEIKRLEKEIKNPTGFYADEYKDAVKEKDDYGIKRYRKILDEQIAENQAKIDELKAAINPNKGDGFEKAADATIEALNKLKIIDTKSTDKRMGMDGEKIIRAAFDASRVIYHASKSLAEAIKKALQTVRDSDWYKNLSGDQKSDIDNLVRAQLNAYAKENVVAEPLPELDWDMQDQDVKEQIIINAQNLIESEEFKDYKEFSLRLKELYGLKESDAKTIYDSLVEHINVQTEDPFSIALRGKGAVTKHMNNTTLNESSEDEIGTRTYLANSFAEMNEDIDAVFNRIRAANPKNWEKIIADKILERLDAREMQAAIFADRFVTFINNYLADHQRSPNYTEKAREYKKYRIEILRRRQKFTQEFATYFAKLQQLKLHNPLTMLTEQGLLDANQMKAAKEMDEQLKGKKEYDASGKPKPFVEDSKLDKAPPTSDKKEKETKKASKAEVKKNVLNALKNAKDNAADLAIKITKIPC